MRVILYGGQPDGYEWCIAGPLDLRDGAVEYAHCVTLGGMACGPTGDGWGPLPTWIYVLTDEVKVIDGEACRVMRQDRVAPRPQRAPAQTPKRQPPLVPLIVGGLLQPKTGGRAPMLVMPDMLPDDPASPFFRAPRR